MKLGRVKTASPEMETGQSGAATKTPTFENPAVSPRASGVRATSFAGGSGRRSRAISGAGNRRVTLSGNVSTAEEEEGLEERIGAPTNIARESRSPSSGGRRLVEEEEEEEDDDDRLRGSVMLRESGEKSRMDLEDEQELEKIFHYPPQWGVKGAKRVAEDRFLPTSWHDLVEEFHLVISPDKGVYATWPAVPFCFCDKLFPASPIRPLLHSAH